jgi:hypothetical protein
VQLPDLEGRPLNSTVAGVIGECFTTPHVRIVSRQDALPPATSTTPPSTTRSSFVQPTCYSIIMFKGS